MPKAIDGKVLKQLRGAKGWSLEELGRKTGLDKQTLHRLENGQRKKSRVRTRQLLSQALGVAEDVLTGEVAAARPEPLEIFLRKFQVNARLGQCARNALSLVAVRYGVQTSQILELAPFFFFLEAERSLRARRERLDKIDALLAEVESLRTDFPQLPRLAFYRASDALEHGALEHERASVQKNDLFGRIVDDAPIHSKDDSYDDDAENPFVSFLKQKIAELDVGAEFRSMTASGSPDYRICTDVVAGLVDGDSDAVEAILSGDAQLHEMPKEVRQGASEPLVAWVKDQAQQLEKHRNEALGVDEFLADLRDGQ